MKFLGPIKRALVSGKIDVIIKNEFSLNLLTHVIFLTFFISTFVLILVWRRVSRTGFIAQEMQGMQKIREGGNLGRKWQFRAEKH